MLIIICCSFDEFVIDVIVIGLNGEIFNLMLELMFLGWFEICWDVL